MSIKNLANLNENPLFDEFVFYKFHDIKKDQFDHFTTKICSNIGWVDSVDVSCNDFQVDLEPVARPSLLTVSFFVHNSIKNRTYNYHTCETRKKISGGPIIFSSYIS